MQRYESLAKLINDNDYRFIAEVGVQYGETSRHLLKHCPKLEQYLLVDVHHDYHLYMAVFNTPATCFRCASHAAATLIRDGSLDLVYIDALHDYDNVKVDIDRWLPKVREGGILCGHDYGLSVCPGVTRAVHDFFTSAEVELEVDDGTPDVSNWIVRL